MRVPGRDHPANGVPDQVDPRIGQPVIDGGAYVLDLRLDGHLRRVDARFRAVPEEVGGEHVGRTQGGNGARSDERPNEAVDEHDRQHGTLAYRGCEQRERALLPIRTVGMPPRPPAAGPLPGAGRSA
jgi:hypothetical protein